MSARWDAYEMVARYLSAAFRDISRGFMRALTLAGISRRQKSRATRVYSTKCTTTH
jgi:hypothetical protein